MGFGETSGVRALLERQETLNYIASTEQRGWYAELLSDIQGSQFDPIIEAMDQQAAKLLTSQIRQEHSDMYALRRDYRYMTFDRSYLYLRGLQNKLNNAYESWRLYVQENVDAPKTATLPNETIDDSILNESWITLMGY